jgi:hypothetical protein
VVLFVSLVFLWSFDQFVVEPGYSLALILKWEVASQQLALNPE